MYYIRRDFDFGDFIKAVGATFTILIVFIGFVGFLLGSVVQFDIIADRRAEHNIYLALKGEQVDDEAAVRTADLIAGIYNGQFHNLRGLKDMDYFGIAMANIDNIKLILEGAPEADAIEVKIPKWGDWFLILGLISLLILETSLSVAYAVDGRNKWWKYPWNEYWAWLAIPTMLPYIVFVQSGTGIYFLVRQIRGEHARERIDKEESQKIQLSRYVSSAQSRLKLSRQAWVDLRVNGLGEEEKSLKKGLEEGRASLVRLGREVEDCQRLLAETQTSLEEIREIIKIMPSKTKDEINQEFDELLRQPGLKAVEISSHEIRLYTETIFIDYHGKTYELGDYLVTISIKPRQYIAIENLRNTSICGLHHPFSRGYNWTNFCFGNNAGMVEKNLKEENFYPLIVFILQAIRSNKGDYSINKIVNWRAVKEE